MTSSYVELPPDSTGSKVRTLSVTTYDATGTASTVVQQVMTLADDAGTMLDVSGIALIPELLEVNRKMLHALVVLTSALTETDMDEDDLGD